MNRSGKRLLVLLMAFLLTIVSTIAFAYQEETSSTQNTLFQALRVQAIQLLIEKKFDHFVTMPFGPGSDNIHLTWSQVYPNYPEYFLNTGINLQDDLDKILEKKILNMNNDRPFYKGLATFAKETLTLSDEEINQLQKVYLFKNEQDLKDLWYVVSSYRTRINDDAAWRKDNITISYRNIGNVRVINTQQQLSFMDEIHYDPAVYNWKRDTVSGLAIMWGVSSVKWWWICGASRGINAAIMTNKAFDILDRHNHTKTWKYMYQNYINGKEYWIPWLDVAVYRMWWGQKDFVFKNIREYPVVLIMNYDGTSWWEEELFVLSHTEDRGTLKYIGKSGNCYSWEANGEAFRSCYNLVSWR